jgi:hypothetical protein
MAEIVRYVDPDVIGGLGNGTSWANAYNSLNAWEAAEQADLVSDGNTHKVWVRNSLGGADTAALTINGWTLGVNNYITIEADPSYRHSGVYNTLKYRLFIAIIFDTDSGDTYLNLWFDDEGTQDEDINRLNNLIDSLTITKSYSASNGNRTDSQERLWNRQTIPFEPIRQ